MTRQVLLVVAVVVTALVVMAGRAMFSGDAELAASNAALEAGDPREAVVRARRAASWYLPGAPHVAAAYQRLVALAVAAEHHRQDATALLAWRAIRAAAIESQWLVTPHRAELERANGEIARLMAKRPNQAEPDAAVMDTQLKKLATRQSSRVGWSLALVVAFLTSAFGLVAWSRRVADAGGKLSWARGRLAAAATLLGAALWLLALWRA